MDERHDKHQYFVVKAPKENLELSHQTGLWATQRNNEQKLVNAYKDGPVILLFSAIKSTRFSGYALMVSLPNPSLRAQWKCPNHIELSDCFRVQWKATAPLHFGDKPYFDCQRLPQEIGRRLCEQLDELAKRGADGAPPFGGIGVGFPGDPFGPHPGEGYRPAPPVEGMEGMGPRVPRMQPTRFFVAKAPPEVLEQSLVYGVWATTTRTANARLLEAFHQGRVILLLSSLNSEYLHGFCRMQSIPDEAWEVDWGLPAGQRVGPPFEVKWYCSCELLPSETNPWDHYNPVSKCGDCTELPAELGNDLCQWMWEQGEPVGGHMPPPRGPYGAPYPPPGGMALGYAREYLPPELDGDWPRVYPRMGEGHPYEEPLDYDYVGEHERFVTQYDGLDLDFHSMPPPAANGGYPDGHDAEWPLNEPATRYFVVRAPRSSFETSLQTGMWATQQSNEARLVAAYEQGPVALLFCPVNSSKLQGFGTMHSLPSDQNHADWQVPSHVALGDSFRVEWKCVATVGVGRIYFDGEELAPQIGFRYCQRLRAAEKMEREAYSEQQRGDGRKGGGGGAALPRRRGRKGEPDGRDGLPGGPFGGEGPGGPVPVPAIPAVTQPLSQATRFFVVRSDVANLQESLRRWVWVIARRTQSLLVSAFRDGRVMLLFAPTGSDRFLGFMKMIGMPGTGSPVQWVWESPDEIGDFFGVSWYCLCDVTPPPTHTPGEDMTELTEALGNELCQLMWESGHTAPKPELVSGADPHRPGPGPVPLPIAVVPPMGPPVEGGPTRYFVLKAPKANITIAQTKGVWATHHRRQPMLLESAANTRVVLLFSALSTQRFQGFASIMGPPGPYVTPVQWDCSKRVAASLGPPFPIRWGAICNELLSDPNPLNSDKPVWDCRDCQEVPPALGDRLCHALEAAAAAS